MLFTGQSRGADWLRPNVLEWNSALDRLNCQTCALATLCVPHAVPQVDLERIEAVIQRGRPLQANEHLYCAGDEFGSLYTVSSGALKIYEISEDGKERVSGFVMPGEMAGLGGISTHRHQSSAVALDTTMICELPFDQMENLAAEIPGLQHYFFESLSRELIDSQQMAFLLSNRTAEERLAAFLWGLSVRHARRKLSAIEFRLPMSRADIASYLGLTPETISRLVHGLQQQGVVRIVGREVEILKLLELPRLAGAQHTGLISTPG